jgi:stearoyl-CoA desaturase (delta-9 desaturase)
MKLRPDHNQRLFVPGFFAQMLAVHVIALAVAPVLFTWQAFLFSFGAALVFGYAMGIFHHMLLTHRSFGTVSWIEGLGALLGTLTWRGPMAGPVRYVAMHRVHHAFSDQELDPHSPIHGRFHALLGWFWRMPKGFTKPEFYEPIAGAVAKDRFLRFLDRHVNLVQALWGVVCFVLGAAAPMLQGHGFDWTNGLRFAVYGAFVKTLILVYLANAVDLVNHSVGYRNYETRDLSTNSFLMGAVHLGGAISWHNNHHAHPAYFTVKAKWWEIDAHYLFIKSLSRLGLTWDIKVLDETKGETKGEAAAYLAADEEVALEA